MVYLLSISKEAGISQPVFIYSRESKRIKSCQVGNRLFVFSEKILRNIGAITKVYYLIRKGDKEGKLVIVQLYS